MPDKAALSQLYNSFPDALLFQYPKKPGQVERDFKWLDSYRYGILHLGGTSPEHLRQRCEHASSILGWIAPYFENVVNDIQIEHRPAGSRLDWDSSTSADNHAPL